MYEILDGKVSLNQIRKVDIEDLLGRKAVQLDMEGIAKYIHNKTVMVTGGGGSIGSELCRQIAKFNPKQLIVFDIYEITRFFMTIPEAAQLVMQAGAFAEGGEIFVLDMGKPVKIYDLAWDLIKLSGFVPNKDIKIQVTGLRPGEKLYEELMMSEEGLSDTKHEKIFIGRPTFNDLSVIKKRRGELKGIIESDDVSALIEKIGQIVPTYNRSIGEVAATTVAQ